MGSSTAAARIGSFSSPYIIHLVRNFMINQQRFLRFYISVFSLVFRFDWKEYQTLKTVFDHISKHLEVRPKYSAARRILNSLLVFGNAVSLDVF